MTLVQIGSSTTSSTKTRRIAPAADCFFSLGIVSSLIGTLGLGVYLWLSRYGLLPPSAQYTTLRSSHAFIQLYGFLGSFIIAFLIQAGPMVFGVAARPARWSNAVAWLLFFNYLAGIFTVAALQWQLGRLLVAVSLLLTIALLAPQIWASTRQVKYSVALPCTVGLFFLAFGAIGAADSPYFALLIFWCGILPVIMAISQQIMHNLFGTKKLSVMGTLGVYSLWALTAFSGWSAMISTAPAEWYLWYSYSALGTIISFLLFTRTLRTLRASDPYGLGFGFAWSWALVGAWMLSESYIHADAALHIWGTGVAMTLIFNVSSRVVTAVTNITVFSNAQHRWLLLLWQVVPLGRGFIGLVPSSYSLTWVVSGVAALVLLCWSGRLCYVLSRFVLAKIGTKRLAPAL